MATGGTGTGSGASAADRGFAFSRVFDAPRDRVFEAWTSCDALMRWWGPRGFTTPACSVDLRPGGTFHYCMRSPDGQDYWGKGIYEDIVAPERIVYTDSFSDEAGNTVSPATYGMPDWPEEVRVTVTFAEREGKTTVTMHSAVSEELANKMGAIQGWNESLDKLDEDLKS